MSCAKLAEPIEMPFEDSGGPKEPCIRWGPDSPRGSPKGKRQFWGAFTRWQQRCSLSMSVLLELVIALQQFLLYFSQHVKDS